MHWIVKNAYYTIANGPVQIHYYSYGTIFLIEFAVETFIYEIVTVQVIIKKKRQHYLALH